jgi:hypothetical protein
MFRVIASDLKEKTLNMLYSEKYHFLNYISGPQYNTLLNYLT